MSTRTASVLATKSNADGIAAAPDVAQTIEIGMMAPEDGSAVAVSVCHGFA